MTEHKTRVDPETGIERPVLVLDRHERAPGVEHGGPESYAKSVDVITPDGRLIVRLNIFANADGWASVDTILNRKTQVGTFLAWSEGAPLVRERLLGTAVFAVDVTPRTDADKGDC